MEFRIYQDNEILLAEPDSNILFPIIEQIIEFNKELQLYEGEMI